MPLGGVKHVVDDVLGVVGARHGEFVIDIDDRRGTSGPKWHRISIPTPSVSNEP